MSELSPADKGLLEAVHRVNVMDVAGRIIANPRRARVSTADALALALAVEQLQAIAIEADLLVRALSYLPAEAIDHSAAKEAIEIWFCAIRVSELIQTARGETQPTGE